MECAGCSAAVGRTLEAVPGVAGAGVDLESSEATVRLEPGAAVEPEAIAAAIDRAGFRGTPIEARRTAGDRRSDLEDAQLTRERNWARRAATGILLWVPIVALHWVFGGNAWAPWAAATLATSSVVLVGSGFYRSAGAALRRGRTNMDTLISLGATTAWIASLVRLIGAEAGMGWPAAPLYFGETAGLFAVISVGHWLEARAGARAGAAIRELLELQPDEANRLGENGTEERIPLSEVRPDDHLRIRPGERIPVDGVVVSGATEIDASAVTGEPLPVPAMPGDTIAAGCLNGNGTVVLRATTDGAGSTVARIAEMVAEAQSSRADIQRLADRISAVFVPAVIAIALVTVAAWWLIVDDLETGIVSAVTVLVISCPCALGIATPVAITVAAGSAGRHGILLRSASAIEQAGRATRVLFDKTGTLTTGRLEVVHVEPTTDATDQRGVLMAAAAVEAMSEHPIGRAIVTAAADAGVPLRPVANFRAIPGEGAEGTVDGIPVVVGRDPGALAACIVRAHGRIIGRIHIADRPRPESASVVRQLRGIGIEPRMLTGDRVDAAHSMAAAVGMEPDEVQASADPAGKRDAVHAAGAGTIVVGDGINDAAALAEADLGIAVGSGTAVALESADVVLTADSIRGVPAVVMIARATLRTIRQNLFFAFFYNVCAIPAAALGLLGPHGPLVAAAAMAMSDLCVVGNAMRLRPAIDRIVEETIIDPEVDDGAATETDLTRLSEPAEADAGEGDRSEAPASPSR